jgi:hypothetical protein
MANVFIPVEFQIPAPKCSLFLALRETQMIDSNHANSRLKEALKKSFADISMDDVQFFTPDGAALPNITAADYVVKYEAQGAVIRARGTDRVMQQLLQRVGRHDEQLQRLQQQLDKQQQKLDELQTGRSQLQQDQHKYIKILRRDIAVRARNLLATEGGQQGGTFYDFSNQLPPEFLLERQLTADTITFLNGKTIHCGDKVAHGASLGELARGLEGLPDHKKQHMTALYNFVMLREQHEQQHD